MIQNYFFHCLTGGEGNEADMVKDDGESDTLSAMIRDAQQHGIAAFSSRLSEILHENAEDDVTEETTNEDLVKEVANVQKVDETVKTQTYVAMMLYLVFKVQLKCQSLASSVLRSTGHLIEDCSNAL